MPVPPLGPHRREIADFLAIGALGFLVDVGLFNLLILTGVVGAVGEAKIIAATAATAVAYTGHRTVTWRHCARRPHREQLTLFVLLNAVALSFSIVTLLVCHRLLGLSGPVVDNVAANGVGLLLGGGFRFVGYRAVVFAAGVAGPAVQVARVARRRDTGRIASRSISRTATKDAPQSG